MTSNDLAFFKKWFSDYCSSFYSPDAGDQKNISLKEEHTVRVCQNMSDITEALPLNDNRKMLAETVALFHDIGRFPQYAKYKTFRDSVSDRIRADENIVVLKKTGVAEISPETTNKKAVLSIA